MTVTGTVIWVILLNTEDFYSISLPTEGMTYPLRCFRQSMPMLQYLWLTNIPWVRDNNCKWWWWRLV